MLTPEMDIREITLFEGCNTIIVDYYDCNNNNVFVVNFVPNHFLYSNSDQVKIIT